MKIDLGGVSEPSSRGECAVLKCFEPAEGLVDMSPPITAWPVQGRMVIRATICGKHLRAIEAGDPWFYDADLREGTGQVLMGADLAARSLLVVESAQVVWDPSYASGGVGEVRRLILSCRTFGQGEATQTVELIINDELRTAAKNLLTFTE